MDDKTVLSDITEEETIGQSISAGKSLSSLVEEETLVGELLSINFSEAQVLVHDYMRQRVRGLPHGSFLVATRMNLELSGTNDAEDEETCLVLLRIVGEAQLPNAREMEHFRFQAGMRSTESSDTWDSPGHLDEWTKNNLSYGAYRCRVLGTFRMKRAASEQYELAFGGDLINYYSGRGMKVFKPTAALLSKIVNYQRIATDSAQSRVRVGRVRFASSEIGVKEDVDNVPVEVDPRDFIARRTFYGGMSRGGKSNAMKITARAIYLLRSSDQSFRVGQLIFDPNGEYANENIQDGGSLKNSYLELKGAEYDDEIETYGLNSHPNDPKRKIVKINFFGSTVSNWGDVNSLADDLDQLFVGKTIIDSELADATTLYVRRFRDTLIECPKAFADRGEEVRFKRLITVYRGILFAAGFPAPTEKVSIKSLFGADLRTAMQNNGSQDPSTKSKIASAAALLAQEELIWSDFVSACKALREFMTDKNAGYADFETDYSAKKNGKRWANDALANILEIYAYPNGVAQFRRAERQHSPKAASDYAADIVSALRQGKLVIFDQSTGDPEQNQNAAERILWEIFNRQKQDFVEPKRDRDGEIIPPPPIMVYLEEAHNLLPAAGGKDELRTVWARTAKEGSKYQIGLVLATQEPSSVMPAILKNTDNWFVAHLNNTDEVRTLSKFYDFEDYAHQIKTISDPGFVRMRTLSNPYTIPVQIDLFKAAGADD
jgi:hypothetical protein